MNLEIQQEELGNSLVQLLVKVDPKEVERAKRKAAKKLGRKARIRGFRPGKAPYHLILQYVGEHAVLDEAVQGLLEPVFSQAIQETQVQMYNNEDLDLEIASTDPLTFSFIFPVFPTVTLGDLNHVDVTAKEVVVGDDDIATMLDQVRAGFKQSISVSGPAEYGDLAVFDLQIERDGEIVAEEVGTRMLLRQNEETSIWSEDEQTLNLGSFIVGLSVDDVNEFPIIHPDTWEDDRLAGHEALYRIALHSLERQGLPPLDDAFAQKVGSYETMEQLRDEARQIITERSEREEFDRVISDILNGLADESEIEYPQAMLRAQIQEQVTNIEKEMERYGGTLEDYLNMRGISIEELEDEFRDSMEEQLEQSLVLSQYMTENQVSLEQEVIERHVQHMVQSYSLEAGNQQLSPEQMQANIQSLTYNLLSEMTKIELYRTVIGNEPPASVLLPFQKSEAEETEDTEAEEADVIDVEVSSETVDTDEDEAQEDEMPLLAA